MLRAFGLRSALSLNPLLGVTLSVQGPRIGTGGVGFGTCIKSLRSTLRQIEVAKPECQYSKSNPSP